MYRSHRGDKADTLFAYPFHAKYDPLMAINLQALGSKLSACRTQLMLPVETVAGATGIGTGRLDGIERGAVEPTGDEVLILADYFRCDYKIFISNEKSSLLEQTDILYRAHGREFLSADRVAIQEFLHLCEIEQFLMTELHRPVQPFAYTSSGGYFKGHAEKAAQALRKVMGHSSRAVPRDVYGEFRSVGVHVFRRRLDNSKISGLFIKHPTAGKCALINYSEDVYRQRFSAAHEMAHAIFDSDRGPSISFQKVDGPDMLEVRANRFASCYLMPPEFLRQLPPPSGWDEADVRRLANDLRVSCDALAYALKGAGLIDDRGMQRIRSTRIPHEAKVDPELPDFLNSFQLTRKKALLERGLSDFYVSLCFDAYRQDVVSLGRLAEILLCSRGELADLARLYGRSLLGN